jgi:hypothetical protein
VGDMHSRSTTLLEIVLWLKSHLRTITRNSHEPGVVVVTMITNTKSLPSVRLLLDIIEAVTTGESLYGPDLITNKTDRSRKLC